MLEVNCDDSLDVMKRLREHRAMIIRDNRHDRERRRGEERESTDGGGERVDGQEKVQQKKRREGEKRDSECGVLHSERLSELRQGKEHFPTNHGPETKAALATAGTHAVRVCV